MKQHIAIFGEFDITCTRNKPVQKTVMLLTSDGKSQARRSAWHSTIINTGSGAWKTSIIRRDTTVSTPFADRRITFPQMDCYGDFTPNGQFTSLRIKCIWWVMTVVWSRRVLGSLPGTHLWISCRFILVKCYHSFIQFSFFPHPSHLLQHQVVILQPRSLLKVPPSSPFPVIIISRVDYLVSTYIWIWIYPPFIFL